MTTNQTERVSDEELDQMIWKLERDGMTPKQLSLMRELREVRRAVTPTDDERIMAIEGIAPPAPVVPGVIATDDISYSVGRFRTHRDCYRDGWNACRAAMLQAGNSRGTPDEQSFWDWLRDEMPTTYRWSRELEDTPENSALITNGKASALDMLSAWKGCSAAMQLSGNSEQLEPVSNRDGLPYDPQIAEYEKIMQQATPNGWRLVPEEPTHEMLEAGDAQFGTYEVYRRMIEAAPKEVG